MRMQDLLNSRPAISLGLAVSSLTPPWFGYPLARTLGEILASRKNNPMVQAVRANQWAIHGRNLAAQQVDALAHNVFRSTAQSLYEFYHWFRKPEIVKRMVAFDSSFEALHQKALSKKQGVLMVAPHMSNFDMVGRAIALNGLPVQLISYPQPPGGYQRQNELREISNLRVTPMSISALQEATETLRAGGTVITGVDRPLPTADAKYRPKFFGREATMPVFHIRLAIKLNIPIYVLGAKRTAQSQYCLWSSEAIEMQPASDLVEETVTNAETVLTAIANNIYRAPDQWAMYYPLWPEDLSVVPA